MTRLFHLIALASLTGLVLVGCDNNTEKDKLPPTSSDTDEDPVTTDDTGTPGTDDTGDTDTDEPPQDVDGDGWTEAEGDCDDMDDAIHPDADEFCDGIDTNCDGLPDDGAIDAPEWYADIDADGYGDEETTQAACEQPGGYVATAGDCDDWNELIHPDAEEICDVADNDCDGLIDEEDDSLNGTTYYADLDGDGFGDSEVSVVACSTPLDHSEDMTDCDDTSADINPEAVDYCGDDTDNNCSGDETDCIEVSINEVHDMIVCDGTPEALRVTGDRFDISYNIHGLWNDHSTELGLRIGSDGTDWVDVTYPGTPFAATIYAHTSDDDGDDEWDTSVYTDGGGSGVLADLVPDCANAISVGDVIGVIHEYTFDHIHVVKTELWKRDEQIARVWYEVTNISDGVIGFPYVNAIWDPDIDFDLHGVVNTEFLGTTDGRFLYSIGPESGWTFAAGICDTAGQIRGAEWGFETDTLGDPAEWVSTCDPTEQTADYLMSWATAAWSLGPGESISDGFIFATSAGGWEGLGILSLYIERGPELCGIDEADWVDDTVSSTVCGE